MPGNVPTMSVPYPHPLFGVDTILGAAFDGSTTYISRGADLTGASTSTGVLTIAFKIRMTGAGYLYQSTGDHVRVNILSTTQMQFLIKNGADSLVVNWAPTPLSPALDDGNYHTVLFSVSLPATEIGWIYVNDAIPQAYNASYTTEDETMDIGAAEHTIGAAVGGASKYGGDVEMFYMDEVYYDFSVESNRRKFFDAGGNSALDVAGSGTPSGGVQPLIYLAGTYDQWEGNKGTGGGFTVTGALTEPAS